MMKIIFCNITYLRYYDGRIAGELKPVSGGRWVQKNADAHEKWNFLNIDGKCYGYVQAMGEQMHIEKIGKIYSQQESADGITIVWCAAHPIKGTVIVGWYENATVNRFLQSMFSTPVSGLDRDYWFSCKAEDAYLIPEENRTFQVGRASTDGAGKGFGQSNVWFAESEYAKVELIPKVIEYMDEVRSLRINTLTEVFRDSGNTIPFSPSELQITELEESLSEEQSFEILPYAYRLYEDSPSADNALRIARILDMCYQYSLAIMWYEKTVELDPYDLSTKGILAYLYQQVERYENSTKLGEAILKELSDTDTALRDDLYCMLADNGYDSQDYEAAIGWLQKIIEESDNRDLITNARHLMENWIRKSRL